MNLPKQYAYLLDAVSPRLLIEFLKYYGLTETQGEGNNPVILGWAHALGLQGIYKKDETPWCALFMAWCMHRCGLTPPAGVEALRALKYAAWGEPAPVPMLGDVLVFVRAGGGHVGLYVGEDDTHFHVFGGNQKDSVCIIRIEKKRLHCARRTIFQAGCPANIRRVFLDPSGVVSKNEA